MITSGINASALELSEVQSGIYEVQNDVSHESEIGMSMSRSYLNPIMKLKIQGGKVYYTIKFSGANYMKNHKILINGEEVKLDTINKDNENHTIELGFETDTINPNKSLYSAAKFLRLPHMELSTTKKPRNPNIIAIPIKEE